MGYEIARAAHEAGHEVVLASLRGGRPPLDPVSFEEPYATAATARFLDDAAAQRAFGNTIRLRDLDYRDFERLVKPKAVDLSVVYHGRPPRGAPERG